jgi:hypothetical protein
MADDRGVVGQTNIAAVMLIALIMYAPLTLILMVPGSTMLCCMSSAELDTRRRLSGGGRSVIPDSPYKGGTRQRVTG